MASRLTSTRITLSTSSKTTRLRDKAKWVCTRCCVAFKLESLSVRTRFGGEQCPLCDDPGSGMEYVGGFIGLILVIFSVV